MKNASLIRSILFSTWLIDKSYAYSVAPQVLNLVKGKSVDFGVQEGVDFLVTSSGKHLSYPDDENEINEKVVAVLSIKGPITKYDAFCGPRGMITLGKRLQNALQNPNISAIVLDADSPGGQASYLETIGNIIQEIKITKPVLGSYGGLGCSASYHILSNCNEIYAQEKNDIVGSIGTMMTFADFSKFYEKNGVKIHEIYAEQSTDKNDIFHQAIQGNYKPLIEEILNPVAEEFIERVKANRPGVSESVFTGKTYTSKKAQKLGLIDGIKTLDQVIERAHELSLNNDEEIEENSNENNTQNNSNMKFENIENALGFTEGMEVQDGHISLSVENATKLNAALAAQGAKPEIKEDTQMTELENRVSALETKATTMEGQIKTIGGATDTPASSVKKDQDEDTKEPYETSDDNPINQAISSDLDN